MDFKKYFSESQMIEISVVKIGNQKITKSIFNQLPDGRKINYPFDFEGLQIIGYVNEKETYVIYTENKKVFKQSVEDILKIVRTPVERHSISTIEKYIIMDSDDDYNPYHQFTDLKSEYQQRFLNVTARMHLFITVLKNHQIFI